MTILDRVKIKLGIPPENTDQDQRLQLDIDELTITILDYCYLKELPETLEIFIANKVSSGGGIGVESGAIASITRGDTTIKYATESATQINQNDIAILSKYRRMVAR